MPRWQRSEIPQEELLTLGLTPEEGFVLSRLVVPLSEGEVIALTGFDGERASAILARLAEKGAVHSDAPAPAPVDAPAEAPLADGPPDDVAPVDLHPAEGPLEGDPAWLEPLEPEPQAEEETAGDPSVEEEALADEEQPADPKRAVEDELNYRKVYETSFRALEASARAAAAQTARGANLMALCFDQDPNVIRALVANAEFGLSAARLLARHHRNASGLEVLAQRADLLKDSSLRRRLLANPQVGEALAKRLLNGMRMADTYKLTVDTDFPERTRQLARVVFRSKFARSQGEERAGIISSTEGRVLPLLTGHTLDARATSILCARTYSSVIFVQNLARFSACPPAILAHLLKQPFVRRTQHLKNMILQHPNVPSEAKRNL